jgi:hypothetical protein
MRSEPIEAEKALYQENGFLSVPSFLEGAELGQWRKAVDGALAARGARRFASAGSKASDVASSIKSPGDKKYYDSVFTQRVSPWTRPR